MCIHIYIYVCVCVWVMRWCEKKDKRFMRMLQDLVFDMTWMMYRPNTFQCVYDQSRTPTNVRFSYLFVFCQRAQIKKMELWRHQQRQQGIVFSPLSSRHIYLLFASNTYNNWLNENICVSLRSFKHENQNIYFSIKLLTIYKWVIFYIHTFPLYHEVCIYTVIFS